MPRPEATTSKPVNLQSVANESPIAVAYQEPAPLPSPLPAGYQHILDQTKSISVNPSTVKRFVADRNAPVGSERRTKKVAKPKNTSPFGSAKMPIPDHHLRELAEAFGDQPARKPAIRPAPVAPTDSARGRLQPTIPAATIPPTLTKKTPVDSLARSSVPQLASSKKEVPSAAAPAPIVKEELLKKDSKSIPAGIWSPRTSTISATTDSTTPQSLKSAPTNVSPKRSTDKPAEVEPSVLPNLNMSDSNSSLPVPELLSPAEKFINKFTASNRTLIYQGIAVLALLAVFFILLWLRLERQHSTTPRR